MTAEAKFTPKHAFLVGARIFRSCLRALWQLLYFLGLGLPHQVYLDASLFVRAVLGAVVLFSPALVCLTLLPPEQLIVFGSLPLWPSALVLGALSMGCMLGLWTRKIVYWEPYFASWLAGIGAWLGLGGRFSTLLGVRAEMFRSESYGATLLGPMWERTLPLLGLGVLVLSVTASSFVFLLCGASRRMSMANGLMLLVVRGHLRSRSGALVKTTTAVAILGVALGVGALIAVNAVMSGYQTDIQTKILSTNAHLVVQKYGLDFREHAQVIKQVRGADEVVAAQPFTFNEAMLHAAGRSHGVLVKGISPEAQVTALAQDLCREDKASSPSGRCTLWGPGQKSEEALVAALSSRSDGPPPALLGEALFQKLGLPVGATFLMMTPVAMAEGRSDVPQRLAFRIAGVFRSGMYEFDSRLVYLPLGQAQALFAMGDTVSGVELRVTSPENISRARSQVLSCLGGYPFRVLDWKELNQGIFLALKLQKIVMFLVLLCIVVVASFNIASTLLMAVIEKRQEVAILKSMGAQDHHICQIFVLQGWLTGLIGIVLGVALGMATSGFLAWANIGLASDVYMVGSLRIQLRPFELLATATAALLIIHLATLAPALRAAGARPVDGLRSD